MFDARDAGVKGEGSKQACHTTATRGRLFFRTGMIPAHELLRAGERDAVMPQRV